MIKSINDDKKILETLILLMNANDLLMYEPMKWQKENQNKAVLRYSDSTTFLYI